VDPRWFVNRSTEQTITFYRVQQVLEEGNRPAGRHRVEQRLAAQVAQVRVPREGHEHVRAHEQAAVLKTTEVI
jgi:hypothetical protein